MNPVAGCKEWWCNIICWGTSYQQVWKLGNDDSKSAPNTWAAFVKAWTRIFGEPEILVCDPGLEFAGEFAEMAGAKGIAVLPTDARSPWQNGRTERAGGEWKRQLKNAVHKDEPTMAQEHEVQGLERAAVWNR